MHRSGTSCLTGSLQQCGLQLGEHSTWNLHNLKGNRENQVVVDFHESVLEANNGSWHTPPKKIIWQKKHRDTALNILKEHANFPLWGFKDPRFLLMLDQWESLGAKIEYIGIFRHPHSVAMSINKRGSGIVSFEKGMNAWFEYNKKLLAAYEKKPFPILCFDDQEIIFQKKMHDVINKMGLQVPAHEEPFYSDSLKNNASNEHSRLPWKIGRLYKKLRNVSQ